LPNSKMKLCFVLGTRPEIIKLYSVMKTAQANKFVDPVFIHTGQHYDYELSQIFLEELNLPKFHHFLDVKSGPHGKQTALLLTEIEKCLIQEKPDAVIVQGDTNTTMAGALAASKMGIPVAHIEAGCRSFDMAMPEEINRLIVDAISSIFFAPSEVAALNLLYEGRSQDRVFLSGNTVVDIVEETRELRQSISLDPEQIGNYDVLLTLHRQENVDNKKRLKDLLVTLGEIRGKVIFPIHPRTKKRIDEFGLSDSLKQASNIQIIRPLNYLSFMKILEDAKVVITDSGGVQAEAAMVGTPCITARDTTEWPETVWSGGNILAGLSESNISVLCNELLEHSNASEPVKFSNPFKGNAGNKIIQTLLELWKDDALNIPKPDMSKGKYPLPWLEEFQRNKTEHVSSTLKFDENGKAVLDSDEDVRFRIIRQSRT